MIPSDHNIEYGAVPPVIVISIAPSGTLGQEALDTAEASDNTAGSVIWYVWVTEQPLVSTTVMIYDPADNPVISSLEAANPVGPVHANG